MVVSYKNFLSMNTDEAIVAGVLRDFFKKNAEVFVPINAQLKDIDLVLTDLNAKKFITIQVKGSRAYEPSKKEKDEFNTGSCGWFFLKEEIIRNCKADYFILLIYVIHENINKGRRIIEPHIITISPKDLYKICQESKVLHKNYSFYIWVNPKEKKAFEYRDRRDKGIIKLNKYLDEEGLKQIKL